MIVQVKLFAGAKQRIGAELVEVELPPHSTIGQLREALADHYPELKEILTHVVFAVNQEYATDQTALVENAEVACIPPVSGGA